MSDVWTLETPDEEMAAVDLNEAYIKPALTGRRQDWWARDYLRKLWDGESWESIKAKLETEGSVWYVWWMDGVRQHLANLTQVMP